MSTAKNDTSDIKKAVEEVDTEQVVQNLDDNKQVDTPANLDQEEQAPFIDDELRTDK